jgi:integrase
MSVLRGFLGYLHTLDPAVPVPPADLFPSGPHRAVPYLYSEDELVALLATTDTLRYPLQRATYRTLISLLAVTGLRVGEAIGLDDDDLDVEHGVLAVTGKFGKPRQVPLRSLRWLPTSDAVGRSIHVRAPRRCSSPPRAPG